MARGPSNVNVPLRIMFCAASISSNSRFGLKRNFGDLDAGPGKRILDRLREHRARRNAARFADALEADRVERRRRLAMRRLDRRHVGRGRQQIVHERRVQQLALLVVDELLVERVADAVRDAAVNLSFDEQRIDDRAAIVDDEVALDLDRRRLGIDLDDHRVHAARGAAAVGPEVGRALEARLGARADGAAQRVRLACQLAERHPALGRSRDRTRGRLPSSSRSAGTLSTELARSRIFSRTAIAAAWHALPATTAPRLANVPVPQ